MRVTSVCFLMAIGLTQTMNAQVELHSNTAPVTNSVELSEEVPVPEEKQETDSASVIQGSGKRVARPGATKSKTMHNADENIRDVKKEAEVKSAAKADNYKSFEWNANAAKFTKVESQSNMQRTQRTPAPVQQQQMDATAGYFETNAPESFEYHYFTYAASNYDLRKVEHLKKAEQLRPESADVHVQMAAYHMITEQPDSAKIYIGKLRDSQQLSSSVTVYAEDLLRSTPERGTLITHGFDDGYGVWYAQNEKKIRTDVTHVSLDFLQSEYYRSRLKKKGYILPTSAIINVGYLKKFTTMNASKKISISLTVPKEYLTPIQSNLFVTGLVFQYQTGEFNNFYRNDYLWNEVLKKDLILEPTDAKGKSLSANYLPMLLQLRKAYKEQGETERLEEMNEITDRVGIQCDKYEQVQKIKGSY